MALGDGIRRNVAKISQEERNRLRDAFIKLNQIFYPGSTTEGPPCGHVSYWFKQDEIHQATHVHGGPAFLTWHRELCNRFEQLLRSVDPDLSLHYWDWTTDPTNLFTSDFMGAPRGVAGEPWLTAGFYDPNANPSRAPAFTDPAHQYPYAPPLSLDRAVQGGIPNLGVSDEQIINAPDYPSMRNKFTGLEAAHNAAHGYIGGTLGDAHTSFRDPFVFLLHSNVDRLFALWQLQDPAKRLDPEQVYGAESNSQAQGRDVGILTPMEPWAGPGAPGIEVGVIATRPWAPPENEQLLHVNQKNSKDPTVVAPPLYDTSPIGTIGTGHFLEFYKSGPTPWQVFDHTPEVGGATVVGRPAIYSEGPGAPLHVYARGVNNHLLELYKSAPKPWQVFDLTPEVGGATIANDPAVFVDSSVHVFGADPRGHLLEFYKSAPTPWQVFDHTPEVGGATIANDPAVFVDSSVHVFAAAAARFQPKAAGQH